MLSIVIVNWNAGPALDACVESVAADGLDGREVLVVDNASTDGSAAAAHARHPWLRLVETGSNLGFAAGANRGAAAARGATLVFLNPDARVLPGALATLVAGLDLAPGAGIAGGGLVDEGGRWQPASARFGVVPHLLLDTTIGRLPARRRRGPHRVDWVYGTFMAVRRDLFSQLGGFDTRHFLYGEDLDLCHRAARLGARTIHVPEARAVHGRNISAVQRYGHGREAEVVKGEIRFYANRGRPGEVMLFRTLAAAWQSLCQAAPGADVEVLVCLNGPGTTEPPALVDLRSFARDRGVRLVEVDLDADTAAATSPPGAPVVRALRTRRAGKALAWTQLRQVARGTVVLFLDADVSFAPETMSQLLRTLAAHPEAVLASARTTCAPRPTPFEAIMAAPYRVAFSNLSPQLYAARTARLPVAMPEGLIEPERWLELVIGRDRVVHAPGAGVTVRLPGSLVDFFRQRIRIEMGKVQLARDYPGLAARGTPQPYARAAATTLDAAGLARLGAYVALRSVAHVVASVRYRLGWTAGVWIKAETTKDWSGG
jgi:hypothetical protein